MKAPALFAPNTNRSSPDPVELISKLPLAIGFICIALIMRTGSLLHFYRTDPAATGAAPNPSDFNKKSLHA